MKASAILRKARNILVKNDLAKGALARNKYRHEVDPTSRSAVKFCAYGALHAAAGVKAGESSPPEFDYAVTLLKDVIPEDALVWGWRSLDTYSDLKSTTKKDVVRLFDRAIKLAKKTEKV